jgi:hypothetical protein
MKNVPGIGIIFFSEKKLVASCIVVLYVLFSREHYRMLQNIIPRIMRSSHFSATGHQ